MRDFIEILQHNALLYPDRAAVIDGSKIISYSEFIDTIETISQHLLDITEKPKVIIDLEQGINAYALIVSVLSIGGTYCPLNPAAPVERHKQIIKEFAPDLIVVGNDEKVHTNVFNNVKCIKDLLTANTGTHKEQSYHPDDIIYVIYTSGSTGVPKGVKICRKALNKFLEWSIPTYRAGEGDIWGQFSYLSFDLSIVDIFTCLCSGATLYAMNDTQAKKFRPAGEIEKLKITIWHSIPSAIEFMIKNHKSREYDFSSVKLMSFCGEPLKEHQVKFLFEQNQNIRVFNTYGPTEGTLFCTCQEINYKNYLNFSHYSISIGKAIPGWGLFLKDIEGVPEKEVVIYGDYIGKGYLGTVQDTKFKDIFVNGESVASFETGDLVTILKGNLYFSSRKDRQVKLKGFRIELDEIDFVINKFLGLNAVTVVNNETLYSFIETDKTLDKIILRDHLKSLLEDYKIPHDFYTISELPRNQNQKIDIDTLKLKLNAKRT